MNELQLHITTWLCSVLFYLYKAQAKSRLYQHSQVYLECETLAERSWKELLLFYFRFDLHARSMVKSILQTLIMPHTQELCTFPYVCFLHLKYMHNMREEARVYMENLNQTKHLQSNQIHTAKQSSETEGVLLCKNACICITHLRNRILYFSHDENRA